MTIIHDLVEDCIQIRTTLQRQLKTLQSGAVPDVSDDEKNATIARIKTCIDEMNALLKEHARIHQF